MPRAVMSLPRVVELLGRPLSETELREALFRTKVEVGHYHESTGEVEIEVNPDRLDLLDEGGLLWEIQSALGIAEGLPARAEAAPITGIEARANASVHPLRPELAMAVAVAPDGAPLDAALRDELVRYQEQLHATLGRDRVAASLGLYPLDRLTPPFHYSMEPLGQIRFAPLGSPGEIDASRFYAEHPMAQKYGPLGRREELALVLRDDARHVMSLPPVLNATTYGEVVPGDRRVLIESTGTRAARTREMVGYMLVPFLARGWKVHPVPVHRSTGSSDGADIVEPRKLSVAVAPIGTLLGVRLTSAQVQKGLLTARLGVEPLGGGLAALVPPWRADLLSGVDLAEEVAIARGYGTFTPILPPALTMGHRLPERRFREQLGQVLLGMGYQELHTQVLLSATCVERTSAPEEAIALRNPISAEYSRVRPTLRSALLEVLGRNTRAGYPQQVFEIGPVIVRDPAADTGTRTDVHLALADAGEEAGFARAASVADRLFAVLGFPAPREPSEAPGSVPGRVARLRIAGELVAQLGEVHPSVLSDLKLQVPVSWVELDLSRIERLRALAPA